MTTGPVGAAAPLGVTLVSGFLGSGKTTLINRILSADHGIRIGVLVNDFGSIDIDSKLIVNRGEDTISLANGCICCTLRDDLAAALRDLVARDVDHVVVEASGVADPRVLANTFMVLDRAQRVALDTLVVVVDSEQIGGYAPADRSLARDQLSQANVVLLNKIDLADANALAIAAEEVKRFCPRAMVTRCVQAEVPLELIIGAGHFDPAQPGSKLSAARDHGFETWSFRCDEPLSLARLREAATDLPANVYRAKGRVHLRERPEHACVLQVVGRRARIDLGKPWGDEPPHTELVFIARGDVDREAIEATLLACTKPPSEPTAMQRALEWIRTRSVRSSR